MNEQIQRLIGNKYFQQYAADLYRARGLQPPPNPGAGYLAWLRDNNPQGFHQVVQNGAARLDAHSARMEKMEKINSQLPPAKVAEAWNALPKSSGWRRNASAAGIDERARRIGLAPLPGMTAGESLLAYLHAASVHPELSTDEGLAGIATATGGALGDAKELRRGLATIAKWHETDTVAHEVGAASAKRDADIAKRKAIVVSNPSYDPKHPPPGAITVKDKPRSGTRDSVAEAYDRIAKPSRVTVRNRRELNDRVLKNRHAPDERAEIDLAPDLKRELVDELRDETFVDEQRHATAGTQQEGQ